MRTLQSLLMALVLLTLAAALLVVGADGAVALPVSVLLKVVTFAECGGEDDVEFASFAVFARVLFHLVVFFPNLFFFSHHLIMHVLLVTIGANAFVRSSLFIFLDIWPRSFLLM